MKANKIFQEKVDQIYAQIGYTIMQKKQLEQQLEEQDLNLKDLEFKLKALVLSKPHIEQVERDLIQEQSLEDSNSGWKDKEV